MIPVATAGDVPFFGETPLGWWEWTLIVVAGLAALAALGAAFIEGIPLIGHAISGFSALGVVAVSLLAISAFNPGGALNEWAAAGMDGDSGPATAVAAAASVGTWNAALYMDTADLTFAFKDAADNSVITPTSLSLWESGVDEKKALEGGSVYPVATATPSSGKATASVNTRAIGCTVDATMELANYYDSPILRGIGYPESGICRTANDNDNTAVTVPDLRMQKIGTAALSGQGGAGATLTCAAAATCTYQLSYTNTVDKTYIRHPAVKFVNVDSATLNSVSGACTLDELSSGAQWIVFDDVEIGPLETANCNLSITRTAGDTDGSYTLTGDDLYGQYDAKGPNSNANINDMAATSAKTVSFA